MKDQSEVEPPGRDSAADGERHPAHPDRDSIYFRALAESPANAIVTLDLELNVLTWNTGAERLLGIQQREMVGKGLAALCLEPDATLALLDDVAMGRAVELHVRLGHRTGRSLAALINVFPARLDDGAIVGSVAIIREVAPTGPLKRRPTVLVVESDAGLRTELGRLLEANGYASLLAGSASGAEELARTHQGLIDALLTDPASGTIGLEALRRVRQLQPRARVVVVPAPRSPAAEQGAGPALAHKPFNATQLLGALAQVVGAGNSASAGLLAVRRPPKILVVDDDEALAASLVRLLAEEELHAISAKSGLHALQLLKQQDFDLIIADQYMPGMDGLKLLELVAAQYSRTERILLTGHASTELVLAAVNRARIAKVLLKGMHPVEIRDAILAVVDA